MILTTVFSSIVKKGEKTFIFTQKWLDHLLLMTSFLVTTETDHHKIWLKMRATADPKAIKKVKLQKVKWIFSNDTQLLVRLYGEKIVHLGVKAPNLAW